MLPEGSGLGDADDYVLLDSSGSLCDVKPEAGNRKLRALFGRQRSHFVTQRLSSQSGNYSQASIMTCISLILLGHVNTVLGAVPLANR